MKLLVYEYIAGGGVANERMSSSILGEGYGMLRTLISDFKAAGHNVTTLLDSRLIRFNPQIEADGILPIFSRNQVRKTLKGLSRSMDAFYVIAPESDQMLQRLVETMEGTGVTSLNCSVDAIKVAANKMRVYETLKKVGLPVPETTTADLREDIKQIEYAAGDLGFPLVFKPIDGVGCCGLSLVRKKSLIMAAVNKIKKETSSRLIILQKLIKGIAASVSLISTGEDTLPLTLNKQSVTLAPPNSNSSYQGGIVPLHHPLEGEALRVACATVKSLRGLQGYIGVDMVLTQDGLFVMEINPRLTTSYLGLRRVVNVNPAQAVIDAVFQRKLPKNIQSSGYAFFSKVKVFPPVHGDLKAIYGLEELVSPPFPITSDEGAYALLVAYSKGLEGARKRFYKAKRRLLKILTMGG